MMCHGIARRVRRARWLQTVPRRVATLAWLSATASVCRDRPRHGITIGTAIAVMDADAMDAAVATASMSVATKTVVIVTEASVPDSAMNSIVPRTVASVDGAGNTLWSGSRGKVLTAARTVLFVFSML